MQLVGWSFARGQPPLNAGHLGLSDLTVLLGPNDAGKSSLLRAFLSQLSWPYKDDWEPGHAVFFCEASEPEARFLATQALTELRSYLAGFPSDATGHQGREWWRLGVWDLKLLTAGSLPEDASDLRSDWLAQLADRLPPEHERDGRAMLAALRTSRVFALEPSAEVGGWNVYWCLPPVDALDEAIELAVTGLGVVGHGHAPTGAEQAAQRRKTEARERAYRREHLRVSGAPVVAAPLGVTTIRWLPLAVHAPRPFGDLVDDATELVTSLAGHLRWAEKDAEYEADTGEDISGRRTALEVWTEQSADRATTTLHPVAMHVRELLSETANELLPDFVSSRYEMSLTVVPLALWGGNPQLRLELVEAGSERRFPVEDVAEGHRLWLQLAVMEATNAVRSAGLMLHNSLGNWFSMAEYADEMLEAAGGLEDDPHLRLAREDAARLEEEYRSERQSILDAESLYGFTATLVVEALLAQFNPGGSVGQLRGMLETLPRRIYVIDEPEQHLHPHLQREAARWLVRRVAAGSSQALVATHSVPFLGIGDATSFAYARRQPGAAAHLNPMRNDELRMLTSEALELGLTRGELLALVRLFLFVEGRHDQVVLEEVLGRELHRHGVAVVPIHSVSRYGGIIDAEVLLRYTTARIAAWFDNVTVQFVERLKSDLTFAERVRKDPKAHSDEERAMAELVLTAAAEGRDIEPVPHPARDIFFLLDEVSIRDLHPNYPGHDAATAALAEAREQQNVKAKYFIHERYGVQTDAEGFRSVARLMRQRERGSEALVQPLNRCRELLDEE